MGNHLSKELAKKVLDNIEKQVQAYDGLATDFYRRYYDTDRQVQTVLSNIKSVKNGRANMSSRIFVKLSRLVSDQDLIGQCAYYLARHDDMTMDFDLQTFLVEQAMKWKKCHGIKRGGGTPLTAMYYLEKEGA